MDEQDDPSTDVEMPSFDQEESLVAESVSDEDDVPLVDPGAESTERAERYLTSIYNAEAGRGLPEVDEETGKAIDKSFRSLEGRLGRAGQKCIQAFHQWGNKFWHSDKSRLLEDLISAYWSQLALTVRKRMDANKALHTLGDNDKIPMPPVMVMGDGPAVPEGYSNPKVVAALNTDFGHYKSVARRIRADAEPNNPEGDKYKSWARLVRGHLAGPWGKKKTSKYVLALFGKFLTEPTLSRWNNAVAGHLLHKYHYELANKSAWYRNMKYARRMVNRTTEQLYKDLANFPISQPRNPASWFPTGYAGLVRNLAVGTQAQWKDINTAEAGGPVAPADLDNPESLQDAVNRGDPNAQMSAAESRNLESSDEPIIADARKKGAKKAKKKAKEDVLEERDLDELQQSFRQLTSTFRDNVIALREANDDDAARSQVNALVDDAKKLGTLGKVMNGYALMTLFLDERCQSVDLGDVRAAADILYTTLYPDDIGGAFGSGEAFGEFSSSDEPIVPPRRKREERSDDERPDDEEEQDDAPMYSSSDEPIVPPRRKKR